MRPNRLVYAGFVLVITIVGKISASDEAGWFTYQPRRMLRARTVFRLKGATPDECAVKCISMRGRCMSFDYHRRTRSCFGRRNGDEVLDRRHRPHVRRNDRYDFYVSSRDRIITAYRDSSQPGRIVERPRVVRPPVQRPEAPSTARIFYVPRTRPQVVRTRPTYPPARTRPSYPRTRSTHRPRTRPSYPRTRPSYPRTRPSYPRTRPSYPRTRPSYPRTRPSYPRTRPSNPRTRPSNSRTRPSYPRTRPTYRPQPTRPVRPYPPRPVRPILTTTTPPVPTTDSTGVCRRAIGLERGVVPDDNFNATSYYWNYVPSRARLNGGSAWMANSFENQYLEITLDRETQLLGIGTQGFYYIFRQNYVKTYEIQYANIGDNMRFTEYREVADRPRVFQGNTDSSTEVVNIFKRPFLAKAIRIRPLTWQTNIVLRVELYVACNTRYR